MPAMFGDTTVLFLPVLYAAIAWIFGGAGLLLLGSLRFARKFEITYGKCVSTALLLGLFQVVVYWLFKVLDINLDKDVGSFLSILFDVLILAVAVVVLIGIIRVRLNITFRQAILSATPLLAMYLLIGGGLFFSNMMREGCVEAICRTRLKGLGTALELYAQAENKYPLSPKELIDGGYASGKNFKCPADSQDREVSYFYLPPLETDEGATFVMCDYKGNHKDKRYVFHKAGHVAENTEEEFQKELAKPYNARFAEALKKAEGP